MQNLSTRASHAEMMDDLLVDGSDLHQALRELDAINYGLGGNFVTLNGLCQLLPSTKAAKIHIVDVGCGSGDMLRRIRSLLHRRNIEAELTGVDANPHVIAFARDHTPKECRIHYQVLDIFSPEFAKQEFDILTATLFFHHFTTEELIQFFSGLKRRLRIGFVVNDIHRHWFAYAAIKLITRIFSRSAMVKNDAPLSVMRAFKKRELEYILHRAGIRDYKIKWCWAFRWQIVVRNDPPENF